MANNIMGSKLLELLAGIDKNKLEEASRMLNSMSKDDLNSIVSMIKNSSNNSNGK